MKFNSREDIIQITPLWKGERLPDGRPNVPKEILDRLRKMTVEEVWKAGWIKNYNYQFERELKHTHPVDVPLEAGAQITVRLRRESAPAVLRQQPVGADQQPLGLLARQTRVGHTITSRKNIACMSLIRRKRVFPFLFCKKFSGGRKNVPLSLEK